MLLEVPFFFHLYVSDFTFFILDSDQAWLYKPGVRFGGKGFIAGFYLFDGRGGHFYAIGFDECFTGFKVAFRFNALNFAEQFAEELAQFGIVLDIVILFALALNPEYDALFGSFFECPSGYQLAVAHVVFFEVIAGLDAAVLLEQGIPDVLVVGGLVGFCIGQKAPGDELRVGHKVERDQVGPGFFQCTGVLFEGYIWFWNAGIAFAGGMSDDLVEGGVHFTAEFAVFLAAFNFGFIVGEFGGGGGPTCLVIGILDVVEAD